jgi:hypothetical protein
MDYAKIGAALHALADVFLAEAGQLQDTGPEEGSTPTKRSRKPTPASPAAASAPVAPSTAAAAPAPAEPAPAPAPTITRAKLNQAVLAVAAKPRDASGLSGRDRAEAILARFGAKNTVTLPQEQWQAVYDAFEEELAKIDAAAVQVAQVSLV